MSISQNYPIVSPSLNLDFANTKKLDPRVSFARASEARYYDGKTVSKAEENLLTYSQEFDNVAWGKVRATVTANVLLAPDGTTTADALTQQSGQTTMGGAAQTISVVAGDCFISVFAKLNGKNFLIIREQIGTGTLRENWFDLSTGTVGTIFTGDGIARVGSIVDYGDGWYRCILKTIPNAARSAQVQFYLADTNASTTVTDSGGIYLWGAQLEQRSTVTAYQPTTTQPITNYIPVLLTAPANVARFEHNPVTGESLGLEVEEQRTNLLTYSEQFDNASWPKADVTVFANQVVAPDGTLTADKLIASATTANHLLNRVLAFSVTSGTAYTHTMYAKAGEYSFIRLQVQSFNFPTTWANFNLADGTVGLIDGSPNAAIVSVGNGWYRCSITSTANGTGDTGVQPFVLDSNRGTSSPAYTGDGYSGIYIWGAQLEAGAFPTSYIKTVASQVTRAADSASMVGSNFSEWYRQDEGTLYYEGLVFVDQTSKFGVSDGTGTNRILMYSSGIVTTNGVNQAIINSGTEIFNVFHQLAMSYKVNDFAFVRNGGAVSIDTQGILPIVNRADIGRASQGTPQSQYIKKIAYYPQRLSNENLQALTS